MKKILAFTLSLLMVLPLLLVITTASEVTPDTTWYQEAETEFTLSDVADLLGFSQLANGGNTFAGKTVKLGDDITLNGGEASFWKSYTPARIWTPVNNFEGTFDGQGHSISGVYCSGSANQAFFKKLTGATVKNLSIKNSYFEGTGTGQQGENVAAFVSIGEGNITIENCTTDAIVSGNSNAVGGFVAILNNKVDSEIHLKNLWFSGSVSLKGRFGGGIIGNGNTLTTEDYPNNEVYATNCLNTGTVYSANTESKSHIGGIVGRNDGTTKIVNCLNIGKVSSATTNSGGDDTLGALFGQCSGDTKNADGTWKAHLSVDNSWATVESCPKVVGNNDSTDPTQIREYDNKVAKNSLKGYGAYYYTNLDFEKALDFETAWAVNPYGLPTLRCFAQDIPPLYKLNAPEMPDPEVKVEGCSGPRWTVTLTIPEGVSVTDIELGALVVPTKAIPAGHTLSVDDESFTYRDRQYRVIKEKATTFQESEDGTIKATFVVTNLDEETARMNFTAVPYATYRIKGSHPVTIYNEEKKITFYRETVLSLEDADEDFKTKAEAVLTPLEEQMSETGGRFPVSETWGKEDLFDEVPGWTAPTSKGTDSGESGIVASQDFGAGNYVISVKGTNVNDYSAYKQTLEQFGFTKLYDNTDGGQNGIEGVVLTSSFKKGDLLLTVTHMTHANTEQTGGIYKLDDQGNQSTTNFDPETDTYNTNKSDVTDISAIWDQTLSPYLTPYNNGDGSGTTMHVSELYKWGNSILFRLPNGHFIMNDGGFEADLPYLLDYMESLTGGETPVVDAWFFSHLHRDHACVLLPFIAHPEFTDRVKVNGFYFSEPSDAVKDLDKGVYNEIPDIKKAIGLLKTVDGRTPQIFRPQTGQRYFFDGMTVEVMLSQEQLPLSSYYKTNEEGYVGNPSKGYGYVDGFNGSSTWLRFNIGDQDIVIAGDSYFAGMKKMMACYSKDMLDIDIFFALHHGFNTWNAFTDYGTFHTVIYCLYDIPETDNYFTLPDDPNTGRPNNANEYLYGREFNWSSLSYTYNIDERMHTGDGSKVLTFPYTTGSYETLDKKTWDYLGQYHDENGGLI